jgi:rbm25 protein, putative
LFNCLLFCFFRGSALTRRLREREKEKEEDSRDRRQEKRELEDLRRKLVDEGHPDPEGEARKRLNSTESDREREKIVSAKIKELMNEARSRSKKCDEDSLLAGSEANGKGEMHVKSFTFTGINKLGYSGNSNLSQMISPRQDGSSFMLNKKKLSVRDVFNSNDDEEGNERSKRRKLLSLNDDNNDSNHSGLSSNVKAGEGSGGTGNGNENVSKSNLSSEEKRKQIKSLIEKIPISKEELFNYSIDWNYVDNNLMEKRIRPWVNKKITEYIGEEEQALLDFICNKLQTKSSAQSILDDVVMVLDDEAEAFVVKMWRLLIYEIEAKKLGLGK